MHMQHAPERDGCFQSVFRPLIIFSCDCSNSYIYIIILLEDVLRAVESITTSWERVTDYGSKVGSLKIRQLLYVLNLVRYHITFCF